MARRVVRICNELGLHARAAARLVECANRYQARVTVTRDERTVNGKSIMGVLMLAAARGAEVTIATEGQDAAQALEAVCGLVEDGFGEL